MHHDKSRKTEVKCESSAFLRGRSEVVWFEWPLSTCRGPSARSATGAATRRGAGLCKPPVPGSEIWTLHRRLQSQGLAVMLPGKLAASLVTLDPKQPTYLQAGLPRELLGAGSLAR